MGICDFITNTINPPYDTIVNAFKMNVDNFILVSIVVVTIVEILSYVIGL